MRKQRRPGAWQAWATRATSLWRESLQFRTVVMALLLSGVAILVIGVYILFSISASLFQSRLDQVLAASENATTTARSILESSDAVDRGSIQSLLASTLTTAANMSSSDLIAALRVPDDAPSSLAPPDVVSPVTSGDLITPEMREQVQENPDQQWWQSVALPKGSETVPGVIVGSQVQLPASAGAYELYLGYSLANTDTALKLIQFTGVIGAVALMILLGVIILLMVRWVIDPIRTAAETSRRFADGDLEARMPADGEDELAVLARSFNEMADSLQARIKELGELSQMQQRFVSDVSHELRTPLTTIRLAGDVLYGQKDSFPALASRTVELLHTQTERFELLLIDLLEISRYDAGSVELVTETANVAAVAGEAVESMRSLATESGSELRLDAPSEPVTAEIDPRRIRRILTNLIGNAIEHGEGKPIVVTVGSNDAAVAVTVRDRGLGMTPEECARVFDRFWRADPSRKRTIGGTGLGLAISLEDAAAHGGLLEVQAKPGKGACFRLTLPRVTGGDVTVSPLPLTDNGEIAGGH